MESSPGLARFAEVVVRDDFSLDHAALLIGAVVPFTFIGIMPTNRALLAPGRDLDATETRTLLERWAKLHAVRTILGIAATVLYLYLALC